MYSFTVICPSDTHTQRPTPLRLVINQTRSQYVSWTTSWFRSESGEKRRLTRFAWPSRIFLSPEFPWWRRQYLAGWRVVVGSVRAVVVDVVAMVVVSSSVTKSVSLLPTRAVVKSMLLFGRATTPSSGSLTTTPWPFPLLFLLLLLLRPFFELGWRVWTVVVKTGICWVVVVVVWITLGRGFPMVVERRSLPGRMPSKEEDVSSTGWWLGVGVTRWLWCGDAGTWVVARSRWKSRCDSTTRKKETGGFLVEGERARGK